MAYLDQPKTPEQEQPLVAPPQRRPVTPEDMDALVGEQVGSLLPDLAHQATQPVDEAGLARATAAARVRKGVVAESKASGGFGKKVDEAVKQVPNIPRLSGSVAAETFNQATDVPVQVVGGVRDAMQGLIEGYRSLGEWVFSKMEPLPPGVVLPGYTTRDLPNLPKVKPPSKVSGEIARSVSHFITGFVAAGPAVKAAGVANATAGALAKGALADFAFYDGHEDRLANMIEDVPELKNPVTEFLAAKIGDSQVEGRLKRAVEGLGLGGLTEGLIRSLRYLRQMKAAKDAGAVPDVEQQLAREMSKPAEAGALPAIGDESLPPVIVRKKGVQIGDTEVPDDVLAKSMTDKGMTPLAESEKLGKSLHLNFAAINGPDDVKRAIADVQHAYRDDIDVLRGGVRKDTQLFSEAEKTNAFEALVSRRDGAPLADKEVIAVRSVWEASASKVVELAELAAKNPTVENEFALRSMLEKHLWIQGEVMGARAEGGRALRAWGVPVGAGSAEKLMAMENALNTYGGREAAQELAKKLVILARVPGGLEKLGGIAEKGVLAKSADVIKELFLNNILSSWQTHAVNVMGNFAANLQTIVETSIASRYSQTIGSGKVQIGEAAAAAFATKQGIREGMQMAWLALKSGQSEFAVKTSKMGDTGMAQAMQAKTFNLNPDDVLGKSIDYLGMVINAPSRALTAEDDFFKAWAYRRAVDQRTFRQTSQEVQDGLITKEDMGKRLTELRQSPPQDIHLKAIDDALYATFTNRAGSISQFVNSLERKLSANDASIGSQIAGLALRYEIPFRNTVANLQQFGFERTPLAPLMQRYKDAINKGGAEADFARTRMMFGTFTLLGLVDLAEDGYITGAGPSYKDSAEKGTRTTEVQSGWQPYSIWTPTKDGKGYYTSYQRTDPIGKMLGFAASIAEIRRALGSDDDKQQDLLKLIAAGAVSLGSQELDRGYMQGISNLFGAFAQPDPSRNLIEKPLVSTVIPNWVTDIRRANDPYQRYVSDLAGELKNRIPGLSKTLPMQYDDWGRPIQNRSIVPGPIKVTEFNPEPIQKEALKEDFNLMSPQRIISANGQKFKLDDAQFSRLKQLRGLKPSEIGVDLFDIKRATERGEPMSGAAFVKKYGDKPLLELANAIVTGKHQASNAYDKKSGGRNGGKDTYITKSIVGRYQRAAAAKLFDEFPDLKKRVISGKSILPQSIELGDD